MYNPYMTGPGWGRGRAQPDSSSGQEQHHNQSHLSHLGGYSSSFHGRGYSFHNHSSKPAKFDKSSTQYYLNSSSKSIKWDKDHCYNYYQFGNCAADCPRLNDLGNTHSMHYPSSIFSQNPIPYPHPHYVYDCITDEDSQDLTEYVNTWRTTIPVQNCFSQPDLSPSICLGMVPSVSLPLIPFIYKTR